MAIGLFIVEPTQETSQQDNIKDLTDYIVFLRGLTQDLEPNGLERQE